MLDTSSPKALRQAIDAALALRRQHTDKTANLLKQYAGKAYRGWGNDNLENYSFKWVTTVVPQLVYNNPRVRVTDMDISDEATETLTLGINALLPQIKYAQQLTLVAYDVQFDFGVTLNRLEPTPGLKQQAEVQPMRPTVLRVSPRMYFRDPDAPLYGGMARHEGHIWVTSRNYLMNKLGNGGQKFYDPAALEKIKSETMTKDLREALMIDGVAMPPDEEAVVCHTLYLREENKVMTVVFNGTDEAIPIREPSDYVGGYCSPYTLYGLYVVPDQVYPLAPLAVTAAQVDEINQHRKQASEDAGAAKRLTMVNSQVQGLVGNVRDAQSGDVLGVPGFNGIAQTLDLGGANKDQLGYIEYAGSNLQQLSGMADFMRSDNTAPASETATEINAASEWADMRVKFIQNQFALGVMHNLQGICEMLDSVDTIAFPAAVEDPITGQPARATFFGGHDSSPDAGQSPWKRAITVQIEPYSMEYVSKNSLRAQTFAAFDQVIKLLQAAPTVPAARVDNMIDDAMETMNIPQGAERYVNMDILRQNMMNVAMMQQAQAMMMGGGAPQPTQAPGEEVPA